MMPTQGLGDAPSRAAKAKSPGERAKNTDLRCEDGVCAPFTGLVAGLSAGPSTEYGNRAGGRGGTPQALHEAETDGAMGAGKSRAFAAGLPIFGPRAGRRAGMHSRC